MSASAARLPESPSGDYQVPGKEPEQKIGEAAAPPVNVEEEMIGEKATEIFEGLQKSAGFFRKGTVGERKIRKVLSDVENDKKELKKLEKQRESIENAATKTLQTRNRKKITQMRAKYDAVTAKIAEQRSKLVASIASQRQVLRKVDAHLATDSMLSTATRGRTIALVNEVVIKLGKIKTEVSPEKQQDEYIKEVVNNPHQYGQLEVRAVFNSLVKTVNQNPNDVEAKDHLRRLAEKLNMKATERHQIQDLIPKLAKAIDEVNFTMANIVDRIRFLGPRAFTGDRVAFEELVQIQARLETLAPPVAQEPVHTRFVPTRQGFNKGHLKEIRKHVGIILDNIWNESHIDATRSAFINLTITGRIQPNVRLLPRYRDIFLNIKFENLRNNPQEMQSMMNFYFALPPSVRDELREDSRTKSTIDQLKRIVIEHEANLPKLQRELPDFLFQPREALVKLFSGQFRDERTALQLQEFRPDVWKALTGAPPTEEQGPEIVRFPVFRNPEEAFLWIVRLPISDQFYALSLLSDALEHRPQRADHAVLQQIRRHFVWHEDHQNRFYGLPAVPFQVPGVDKYRIGSVPKHTINATRTDVQALCRLVPLGNREPKDVIAELRTLRDNNPQLMMAVAGDRVTREIIEEVIFIELSQGPSEDALALQFDLHLDQALYATENGEKFTYGQLLDDIHELDQMGNARVTAFAIRRLQKATDHNYITPQNAEQLIILKGFLMKYKRKLPASVNEETLQWMRTTGPQLRKIQEGLRDPMTRVQLLNVFRETRSLDQFMAFTRELAERIEAASKKGENHIDFVELQDWQRKMGVVANDFLDRATLRDWSMGIKRIQAADLTNMTRSVYLSVLYEPNNIDNIKAMIRIQNILSSGGFELTEELKGYKTFFEQQLKKSGDLVAGAQKAIQKRDKESAELTEVRRLHEKVELNQQDLARKLRSFKGSFSDKSKYAARDTTTTSVADLVAAATAFKAARNQAEKAKGLAANRDARAFIEDRFRLWNRWEQNLDKEIRALFNLKLTRAQRAELKAFLG